jgi:hypothetical protein
MKKNKKEKEIKFLHERLISDTQLYQMQRRVRNWHKFYYKKVFLPLTRSL